MIGRTLAHYHITASIGAGGMGEVYRATDAKLGREVALKVLPGEVAQDPERLARFRREAQLLAALNHPNVAAIHGLEEAEGQLFLVLELVEGEDLAERLKRGPFSPDEAMVVAMQIAEALEEAHEKGIVHRDLKPANVKLTPDGKVKVLDFGLAKAWVGDDAGGTSSADFSQSPTLARTGSAVGLILGTAAYMAPEQARGKRLDRRADIWSFGVLVFEMLTGSRLFSGETVSDTLAAVLRQDIDWKALPAGTPPALHHLLRRCLERDPRRRLRDIGEARIALADPQATESLGPGGAASPARGAHRRGYWLAAVLGALAGVALGVLSPWRAGSRAERERPSRTLVLPAEGRTIADREAISPDGRWVAYTAKGSLWLRNLGELEAREVPDAQGALRPFWSPRGDAVAFAVGNGLFRVSLQGGRPTELCRFAGGEFTGGSWSATAGIVFTLSRANWDGDVLHVPEDGGEPDTLTKADPALGERRLYEPHFLPDGRSLLFTVVTRESNDGELAIHRNGRRTRLDLGNGTSEAAYSPSGHLVFTRSSGSDRSLWAVPFEPESQAKAGTPFRIAVGASGASASADATLVYGRVRPDPQQLLWVDHAGRQLGVVSQPLRSTLWDPAVSPDGQRVAATVDWNSISIWDTERGVETRLTSDTERVLFGNWLPGGLEVAYTLVGGGQGLRARRADGSGQPRVLLDRSGVGAASFSSDGKFLAFYLVDADTGRDLWAMATENAAEPFLLLRTQANEAVPRVSPDGRFVAYQSDASGRWEVYVMPFPRGEGRWRVSTDGGAKPTWNPRGGAIYFVSGNDLMAADVSADGVFRVSAPRRLFDADNVPTKLSLPGKIESFYDVAPDGRRFVVVRGVGMGTSDVVLADGLLRRARDATPRASSP